MANVAQVWGGGNQTLGAGATRYVPLGGSSHVLQSTEALAQVTHRYAGTLSKCYVRVSSNDRGTSTFRTRINGANGNISVSITASTTGAFTDLSNSDSFSSADELNYSLVTGAGGTTFIIAGASILVTPSSGMTQRLIAHNGSFATASVTQAVGPAGAMNFRGTATETNVQFDVNTAGTHQNLFVYVNTNARTTTTTLGNRINGTNGAMSVSVVASATGVFEDTTNTNSIAANDDLDYYITTGTGTETIAITLISSEFVTSNSQYLMLGTLDANNVTQAAALTRYRVIAGNPRHQATTESDVQLALQTTATLSNLFAVLSANGSDGTTTIRTRVNTADGGQSLSIATTLTGAFEDTSGTDVLAATTDLVNYSTVTTGTVGTINIVLMGIMLLAPSTGKLPSPVEVLQAVNRAGTY